MVMTCNIIKRKLTTYPPAHRGGKSAGRVVARFWQSHEGARQQQGGPPTRARQLPRRRSPLARPTWARAQTLMAAN